MKQFLILLVTVVLIGTTAKAQNSVPPKADTSKVSTTGEVPLSLGPVKSDLTDSTALISIKDVQTLGEYLKDRLTARQYETVMLALNQLLQEGERRRQASKVKKPK